MAPRRMFYVLAEVGVTLFLQARQLLQARDEIRSARAPIVGDDFERLDLDDDLNFTSSSWDIALDRRTGKRAALTQLIIPSPKWP